MNTDFYIGKRLSYDGRLCTVRYHGAVQGTKGEWLGVEWDDPTRGKHAGEHQGVKYFECESNSYAELLGAILLEWFKSHVHWIFKDTCPNIPQDCVEQHFNHRSYIQKQKPHIQH